MNKYQAHLSQSSETPRLFWWIVGVSVALALIPTVWTAIDLQTAGLFIGDSATINTRSWLWVELINVYIPAAFRVVVLAALAGWIFASFSRHGKQWRLQLAFVVLAGKLATFTPLPGGKLWWNAEIHPRHSHNRPMQQQLFFRQWSRGVRLLPRFAHADRPETPRCMGCQWSRRGFGHRVCTGIGRRPLVERCALGQSHHAAMQLGNLENTVAHLPQPSQQCVA
jgi:hypothetical protein